MRTSSADCVFGSRMPSIGAPATASTSSRIQPDPSWLTRTHVGFGVASRSTRATVRRASSFRLGATASSSSRITASTSDAYAFSMWSSRCPTTYR